METLAEEQIFAAKRFPINRKFQIKNSLISVLCAKSPN